MHYIIAGPCAIESVDSFVGFADVLVQLFERFPKFKLVYKGSFDKANRSSAGSPRGVGLVEAQLAFSALRAAHPSLLLTTDIHETWQASQVDVDVLQIPAFLGKQTSLLEAAAATGRIVNLKKPQWEGPDFFYKAESKLRGAKAVWFTHRGTGLPGSISVPLHELCEMSAWLPGNSRFLDLTHTNRGATFRSRHYARAAWALGIQNFFAEVHPNPKTAISDRDLQLDVNQLTCLLMNLSEAR